MPRAPRQMRLTERHVALMRRDIPELPGPPAPGVEKSTDEDHAQTIRELLSGATDDSVVWIFAYGSLIWKPAFDFVEMRVGLVRGWHRAFCLGWNTRFRGSDEAPGLMLALAPGGACKGVLYRMPPDAVEPSLSGMYEVLEIVGKIGLKRA